MTADAASGLVRTPLLLASLDPHDTAHARPGAIWRRFVAAGIDAGVSFGAAFLIGGVVSGASGSAAASPGGELIAWAHLAAFAWQYHVRQPVRHGGTPGMRLLGLRVMNAAVPAPISTRQAVLRFCLCAFLTWPVLLGLVLAFFDRRRRGWHDRVAGTMVVAR